MDAVSMLLIGIASYLMVHAVDIIVKAEAIGIETVSSFVATLLSAFVMVIIAARRYSLTIIERINDAVKEKNRICDDRIHRWSSTRNGDVDKVRNYVQPMYDHVGWQHRLLRRRGMQRRAILVRRVNR